VQIKLNNEFFGSLFGLLGAFTIAVNNPIGFWFFLISNLCMIHMGFEKKMKPFLVMQGAFLLTSLIGIYTNYFA